MKQGRFLELLNLYIDGEIAPSDAVELEHEIVADPDRLRIYNEYCQIHRATRVLYERFREAAASQSDTGAKSFNDLLHAPGEHRSVQTGRTRWAFRAALAGGVAAAASLAVYYSGRGLPAASTPEPVVAREEAAPVRATEEVRFYAAPFAPEVRPDPFLSTMPSAQTGSPLSVVSWPLDAPSWPSDGMGGFSPSDRRPAFSESWTSDLPSPFLSPDSRRARVFRSGRSGMQVQLEPVGYHIHR